jgi:hypothetical protein
LKRFSIAAPIAAALLACLVSVLALGCTNDAKAQTASLSAAVARYHLADNPAKPGAAEGIARVACTEADVCEAKKACAGGSAAIVQGLALKAEVEIVLAEVTSHKIANDDPRASAAFGKLDEGKRLLDQGHAALETCDTLLAALKRNHS